MFGTNVPFDGISVSRVLDFLSVPERSFFSPGWWYCMVGTHWRVYFRYDFFEALSVAAENARGSEVRKPDQEAYITKVLAEGLRLAMASQEGIIARVDSYTADLRAATHMGIDSHESPRHPLGQDCKKIRRAPTDNI